MSKIIVDQIQKNGGDVLTLPATDATANNQPLVGSTTGVLSHSPLSLPAADGTANKPVTTDGSAQLQFGAFALPSTAGTDGQVLTSTGSAAAWEAINISGLPVDTNSDNIIGTVVSDTARGNAYSDGGITSNTGSINFGPQHMYSTNSHMQKALAFFMGDQHPDNAAPSNQQTSFGTGNDQGDRYRTFEFANNKRVGDYVQYQYSYDNSTSYCGHTFRMMPIRNKGSSSINVTVNARVSSRDSGQDSSSLGYGTPTNSSGTLYSTVTGVSWTNIATNTSSTDSYTMSSSSVAVPAGKTILVFLVSTYRYHTTYQFVNTNCFVDLHTTFSDANITSDARILHGLQTVRINNATESNMYFDKLYTNTALLYGDR